MTHIRYQAKIFKDGKSYSVVFPDLSECFSAGDTKEEACENAREALSLYLEDFVREKASKMDRR